MRFIKDLTGDEIDALHSSISQLQGTTKIEIDKLRLVFEYEFPLACFADVWQLISEFANTSNISLSNRLRHSLLSFAEQNERDHRLYPGHWHTYVEDIYVHYFDYQGKSSSDTSKQLWRRYKKNS